MTDDILSQEELDALLAGGIDDIDTEEEDKNLSEGLGEESEESTEDIPAEAIDEDLQTEDYSDILTEMEMDALGEIGNISMGTAATTLSTLLDQKVNITTPSVKVTTPEELSREYEAPLVAVDVGYKEGLEGSNVMILKTDDAKIITDLMMGKEEVDTNREITDMDLSAVSEAMNQMMGSSSTSLSEMLDKKIDIKPPRSEKVTFLEGRETIDLLKTSSPIIKISFRMEIGNYMDSNIMQLIPIEFGKEIVSSIMSGRSKADSESDIQKEPIDTTISEKIEGINDSESILEGRRSESQPQVNQMQGGESPEGQGGYMQEQAAAQYKQDTNNQQTQQNQYMQQPQGNLNMGYNMASQLQSPVAVSRPEFQSFDSVPQARNGSEIDLVGDIPVEITVELGRTHKKIGEILEFGVGTVIELDKLVGEALNIYANGKYIASGEVVVIDDNFGIRVTEIDNEGKNII